jgi:hypothetical protein
MNLFIPEVIPPGSDCGGEKVADSVSIKRTSQCPVPILSGNPWCCCATCVIAQKPFTLLHGKWLKVTESAIPNQSRSFIPKSVGINPRHEGRESLHGLANLVGGVVGRKAFVKRPLRAPTRVKHISEL